MFSMSLFVLMFLSFGHCVVCLSSIYRFCGIFKFFIFQFENNRYLYYMSFITDLIIFMWPMNCVCMIIFVSGLVLWCLTPVSTIFQLFRGGQFYEWRKPEYLEKPSTCSKSLTTFITYCCTYRPERIITHNISGDRNQLHR
jgi:hypothetical protein